MCDINNVSKQFSDIYIYMLFNTKVRNDKPICLLWSVFRILDWWKQEGDPTPGL